LRLLQLAAFGSCCCECRGSLLRLFLQIAFVRPVPRTEGWARGSYDGSRCRVLLRTMLRTCNSKRALGSSCSCRVAEIVAATSKGTGEAPRERSTGTHRRGTGTGRQSLVGLGVWWACRGLAPNGRGRLLAIWKFWCITFLCLGVHRLFCALCHEAATGSLLNPVPHACSRAETPRAHTQQVRICEAPFGWHRPRLCGSRGEAATAPPCRRACPGGIACHRSAGKCPQRTPPTAMRPRRCAIRGRAGRMRPAFAFASGQLTPRGS